MFGSKTYQHTIVSRACETACQVVIATDIDAQTRICSKSLLHSHVWSLCSIRNPAWRNKLLANFCEHSSARCRTMSQLGVTRAQCPNMTQISLLQIVLGLVRIHQKKKQQKVLPPLLGSTVSGARQVQPQQWCRANGLSGMRSSLASSASTGRPWATRAPCAWLRLAQRCGAREGPWRQPFCCVVFVDTSSRDRPLVCSSDMETCNLSAFSSAITEQVKQFPETTGHVVWRCWGVLCVASGIKDPIGAGFLHDG